MVAELRFVVTVTLTVPAAMFVLDVAADHEDRGGNLKFLVKFRDLREKDGRRVLRHFPADPFLARRASGDAFRIVTDNQR